MIAVLTVSPVPTRNVGMEDTVNVHYLDRPRFTEPEDDTTDLTGVAVEIEITDAPVMIGPRTVAWICGRAHITGADCGSYTIDDLWWRDAITGAFVSCDEERGTGSPTLEGHIARALAAEVDKVAIQKLREAM